VISGGTALNGLSSPGSFAGSAGCGGTTAVFLALN
jgi:hypothetical protein